MTICACSETSQGCMVDGTCVALSPFAMLLSETITIYLAVAAPFAVSCFLRLRNSRRRPQLLLKSVAAGLLWPLAALRFLLTHARHQTARATQRSESISNRQEIQIEEAKRSFLHALYEVRERAQDKPDSENEKLERAAYVLRDSVEKYVGLADAVKDDAIDDEPDARELELFRIAGRKGEDLLLAGRCAHRHNVKRVREHHRRARTELLHALAEVGEAASFVRPAAAANAASARRLSIATLRLYGRAVDLLSLLEDEDAALKVARLLDQECARLRRLQTDEAGEAGKASKLEIGEDESCAAHTSRPSLAPLSGERTLQAQG